MPRKPRIEYAGACYHVMCRGNRREAIFYDDQDRKAFLDTLGQACERTGWWVHSYVLMSNHYHLLLETPEPNLSEGMRWFQGTYAQRFSARHGLVGHVFQGRFKSPVIDSDEPGDFGIVSNYIHLNPARARLLSDSRPVLRRYPWSSFSFFLKPKRSRPRWLVCERVLGALGFADERAEERKRYGRWLEARARAVMCGAGEQEQAAYIQVRRGWCLGGEAFKEKVLGAVEARLKGKKRASFGGRILKAHDEHVALQMIKEGWEELGIEQDAFLRMPKSAPRKGGVAWLLRNRTVMTYDWIGRALGMGSRINIYRQVKVIEEGRSREARRIRNRLAG